MDHEIEILETDDTAKNGQTKCPKCGATDISLNTKTGKLRCNFCRHEFEPRRIDDNEDLSNLTGEIVGSGAKNIEDNTDEDSNILTLKCTSCGAEIVVDTSTTLRPRCHWCRNALSINEKLPNGAVPDEVLPFKIAKNEAEASIKEFVGKRKFFAHPVFKREFTTDNIMGVYLPYLLIDENTHVELYGEGEHETRSYTVKRGDHTETRYDADAYNVERKFDMTVEGLTVESSSDKLANDKGKTNNIINSIMPFDTENAVKWDANYLKGYTSEKRDVNIDDLKEVVKIQSQDIARNKANDTLKHYDRGVRWEDERIEIKGQKWKAAYLPVWIYSYYQKNANLLHYVAVNARTKETMGSVPINKIKLFITSVLVEILGVFLMILSMGIADEDSYWPYIFLLLGVVFYAMMYGRYRNQGARHYFEKETKAEISDLRSRDDFKEHRRNLSNSTIRGKNNTSVRGVAAYKHIMDEKLTHAVRTEAKKIKNDFNDENPE